MSRPKLARLSAVLLLAAGAAAIAPAAPVRSGTSERYTLPPGEAAIYDLAGHVRLQPANGDRVVVEVARGGRDGHRLDVATGPIGGRQTLRVRFPDDRVVYGELRGRWRTDVRVRDDGTFGDDGRRTLRLGGRRVQISNSGGGLHAHADLAIGVPDGAALTLHLAAGKVDAVNVDGRIQIRAHAAKVSASGTRGSLLVDNGSGAVDVRGAHGDLDVDTGSGAVTVEDFKGAALSIDTGSGGVEASLVQADELRVDTGSGHVELNDVRADDIVVDTGSGGVSVELDSDVSSLAVDTGSGGVSLYVPRNLGATYEIETGSGGISVDVPHESQRMRRGEARGRIGDGRGRIRVDTGSGSVQIRPRASGGAAHGAVLGRLLGRFE